MTRPGTKPGGARCGRFRAQAWLLGGLAAAIYLGYVAFMVARGAGGA